MPKSKLSIAAYICIVVLLLQGCTAKRVSVSVTERFTGRPIQGATVEISCSLSNFFHGSREVKELLYETDENGEFSKTVNFGRYCSSTYTRVYKKGYAYRPSMDRKANGSFHLSLDENINLDTLRLTCSPRLPWKARWKVDYDKIPLESIVTQGNYGRVSSGFIAPVSKADGDFISLFSDYKSLSRRFVTNKKEQAYLDSCFCPTIEKIHQNINQRFLLMVKNGHNVARKEENELLKRCGLPHTSLTLNSPAYIEGIKEIEEQKRRERSKDRQHIEELNDAFLQHYSRYEDRIKQDPGSRSTEEEKAYYTEVCIPLFGYRTRANNVGRSENYKREKYIRSLSWALEKTGCTIATEYTTEYRAVNGKCPEGKTLYKDSILIKPYTYRFAASCR